MENKKITKELLKEILLNASIDSNKLYEVFINENNDLNEEAFFEKINDLISDKVAEEIATKVSKSIVNNIIKKIENDDNNSFKENYFS